MVSSLTLPQPPAPRVVSVGRRNVTLAWKSKFTRNSSDKTYFGYNISVCGSSENASMYTCVEHHIPRDHLVEKIDTEMDSLYDSDFTMFEVAMKDLEPGKAYKFRLIMVVGTSNSNPGDWTNVVTTHSLTAPQGISGPVHAKLDSAESKIFVVFNPPLDDGGSPILRHHVYVRNHDNDIVGKWKIQGSYDLNEVAMGSLKVEDTDFSRTVVIKNLLPGCSYDFKVSAVNEVGESPLSKASNVQQLVFHPSDLSILIRGYHESLSFVKIDGDQPNQPLQPTRNILSIDESRLTILNDTAQTLSSIDGHLNLPVWSSYYSPRKFSVMASMVFYDPSQGVLEGDLSGKIAVMRRDGEPISVKARKAQASGAIGAVVVDSGACTGFNQQCLPGSDKDKGELFAEIDPPKSW